MTQEIHIKELPADSERYFAKSDSEEIVRQLQVGCMIHLFFIALKFCSTLTETLKTLLLQTLIIEINSMLNFGVYTCMGK